MINALAQHILQFNRQSGAAPIEPASLIWLLNRWTQLPQQRRKTLTNEALREAKGLIEQHFSQHQSHQAALHAILAYLIHVLGWTVPTSVQKTLHQQEQQRFSALATQGHRVAKLKIALAPILKGDTVSNRLDIGVTALYFLTQIAPLPLRHLVSIINVPHAVAIIDGDTPIVYFELGRDLANGTAHAASYGVDLFGWQRLKQHHQQGDKSSEIRLLAAINCTLSEAPLYFEPLSKHELTVLIQAYWHIAHGFDMPTLRDWSHPELSAAIPRARLLKPALTTPNSKPARASIWSTPKVSHATGGNNTPKWPHKALLDSIRKRGKHNFDGLLEQSAPVIEANNVLPYVVYEQTKSLLIFGGKTKEKLAQSSIAIYTSLDGLLESHPLPLAACADEEAITAWAQRLTEAAENDSQRTHLSYLLRFMATFELTEALQLEQIESSTTSLSINPNRVSPLEFGKTIECLFETKSDSALITLFAVIGAILGFYGALRSGEVARLRMRDVRSMPGSKSTFQLIIGNTAEGKTKNRRRREVYLSLPESCAYWLRLLLVIKQGADADAPLIGFATEAVSTRISRYLAVVSKALQWVTQSDIRFHHLRHSGAQLLTEQVRLLRRGPSAPVSELNYDTASYDHAYQRFSAHHQGESIEHLNDAVLFGLVGTMLGHSHHATTRKSYLHGHERMRLFLLPEKTLFEKWELRFVLGLAPGSNDLSRHLKKLQPNPDIGVRQQRKNQAVELAPQALRAYVLRKHRQGTNSPAALLPLKALNRLWLSTLIQQGQRGFIDYLLLQLYRAQRQPSPNDTAAVPISWELINAAFNHTGRYQALALTPKQRRWFSETLRQFTLTYQQGKGVVVKRWFNADSAAIDFVATLTGNNTFGLLQARITLYANRKTQSNTLFNRLTKEVRLPHQLLPPRSLMNQGQSQIAIELSASHFPIKQLVSLYCDFLTQ
ncbi:hypothetical protein [uncultured Ferrimonas sp.]|uniref:hypothetical protein n=1 Tax=uncultured Ferrimonas sp. TaxID=432640 RepID=UPI002625D4F1|nr:hypothetical protein [uncultured Ferrimonas sp.]